MLPLSKQPSVVLDPGQQLQSHHLSQLAVRRALGKSLGIARGLLDSSRSLTRQHVERGSAFEVPGKPLLARRFLMSVDQAAASLPLLADMAEDSRPTSTSRRKSGENREPLVGIGAQRSDVSTSQKLMKALDGELPSLFRLVAATSTIAIALQASSFVDAATVKLLQLQKAAEELGSSLSELTQATTVLSSELGLYRVLDSVSRFSKIRETFSSTLSAVRTPKTQSLTVESHELLIGDVRDNARSLAKQLQEFCSVAKCDPEVVGVSCAESATLLASLCSSVVALMEATTFPDSDERKEIQSAIGMLCEELENSVAVAVTVSFRPCDACLDDLLTDAAVQMATALGLLLHVCQAAFVAFRVSEAIQEIDDLVITPKNTNLRDAGDSDSNSAAIQTLDRAVQAARAALAALLAAAGRAQALSEAAIVRDHAITALKEAVSQAHAFAAPRARNLVFEATEQLASSVKALVRVSSDPLSSLDDFISAARLCSDALDNLLLALSEGKVLEDQYEVVRQKFALAHIRVMAAASGLVSAADSVRS